MSEQTTHVMMNWLWAFVTLGVCLIAMVIIVGIVRRAMKRTGMDPLLISFVVIALRVACIAVAVIAALEKVGVNPSSFITVLGVSGAAIALAVKDSLANIAGGVMIIVTHQFKKDDYIEVSGYGGYVQQTDLLMTTLKTYDNKIISIPNSVLSSSVVTNYDAKDMRRITLRVSVDINEDIAKVKDLVLAVAEKSPMVLDQPAPAAHVDRTGEGVCEIDLFVWCRTDEYWAAYYDMNEHVGAALNEAGIVMRSASSEIHIVDETR